MIIESYYLYRTDAEKTKTIAQLAEIKGDNENVSLENIENNEELLSLMVSESEAARRYAHGDLSFVARIDGRLAAILWACHGDCFIRGVGTTITCGFSGSYFYNVFVFPEFRRNKFLIKLMSMYANDCLKKNISELYALVLTTNDKMNSFMGKYFYREKNIKV